MDTFLDEVQKCDIHWKLFICGIQKLQQRQSIHVREYAVNTCTV